MKKCKEKKERTTKPIGKRTFDDIGHIPTSLTIWSTIIIIIVSVAIVVVEYSLK